MGKLTGPLLIIAFLLAACCLGPNVGTVTTTDIAAFQNTFMSSYFAERGGYPAGSRALMPFSSRDALDRARATVPVSLLTDNSFLNLSPTSFTNYPEPNQTTVFDVISYDAASNVYRVVAVTGYAPGDFRSNYVEEYYVRDIGLNASNYFDTATPDSRWTMDDPIVTRSGGVWVQDQKARVQMVLTFADGTTRTEYIVSQTDFTTGTPKYASFDVNGSLDFSQLFIPATDSNAAFSSVVMYKVTPSTNPNFWFWQGSQAQSVLGVRYYTEFKDSTAGELDTYTILFEKTLSTLDTTAVSAPQVWQTVFVGSQYDTLAESVLRQKTTYSLNAGGQPILSTGTTVTNMQSRVVDITGMKDFYLQQLDTDYATLTGWDTTTIYTPTGNAAEIIAADPDTFLYSRTLLGADGIRLWGDGAYVSGLGDLAGLYTSLQNGAANLTIPSADQLTGGPFISGTGEQQFSGSQGSQVPTEPALELTTQGTVEAWVYIKQHSDTGGIVHKGVSPDFLDECYSLQFWGNQGQLAFVIDPPTAGGTGGYDLCTSTINLNTGRWYYIVATWDTTLGSSNSYMKLFINGAQNRSVIPTNSIPGGARSNSSDLLIGSQLPTIYSVAYGYFGLNGAIYGVKVYGGTPPTAAAILQAYNDNSAKTANWPHP